MLTCALRTQPARARLQDANARLIEALGAVVAHLNQAGREPPPAFVDRFVRLAVCQLAMHAHTPACARAAETIAQTAAQPGANVCALFAAAVGITEDRLAGFLNELRAAYTSTGTPMPNATAAFLMRSNRGAKIHNALISGRSKDDDLRRLLLFVRPPTPPPSPRTFKFANQKAEREFANMIARSEHRAAI